MKFLNLVTVTVSLIVGGPVYGNQTVDTATAQVTVDASESTTEASQVVEAQPLNESKAESARKARQFAELETEQAIVERLEAERLKEERARIERLFGKKSEIKEEQKVEAKAEEKVEAKAETQAETQTAAQEVVVPAATEAKANTAAQSAAPAPTQVVIEKVEIIQPAPAVQQQAAPAPVAESKLELEEVKQEETEKSSFYLGAAVGSLDYSTSNIKENFGLGLTLGYQVDPNWALEGFFFYSNSYVDTFWDFDIFREMDQYDIGLAAKYYLMTGKLRPYVGASVSYIRRTYTERVKTGQAWINNNETQSAETQSVNGGLMAGIELEVTRKATLGLGIDWSTHLFTKDSFGYQDYLLEDEKLLEEISFLAVKVFGKFTF